MLGSDELMQSLARNLGASDAELFRGRLDLGELVRIGQFRGLGKVSLAGADDALVIRVCNMGNEPRGYVKLVSSYYLGLLTVVFRSHVELVGSAQEEDCVSLTFRVRK